MKCIIFFILTIASCYAEVEFSGRPRNFSLELLHHTLLETDGHVVISPFGIWTLMTGVAIGATGRSRSQLVRAALLPKDQNTILDGYRNMTKTVLDPKTQGVQLTSKNFVFTDKGFAIYPAFKRTLTSNFQSNLIELDFTNPKSAARIANTVIESTGATVSNVLRSDDFEKSRMIVTNVISFKGLWSSPFNKSDTTVEKFYDENKKEIGQVNMMYQRAMLPYSNLQALSATVVELPYGNDNKYSMLIILPYPKISVSKVYQKLSVITIKDIFAKLVSDAEEYGIEDVDLKVPRFKISTNVVLNKPLNNMGVTDIFSPQLAKFENVSKHEFYISAIVHKADIEVTESGTVASAATSAYFSDRISTPTFEANRPFIYFVIEKTTTTIIFSGVYSKPSIF